MIFFFNSIGLRLVFAQKLGNIFVCVVCNYIYFTHCLRSGLFLFYSIFIMLVASVYHDYDYIDQLIDMRLKSVLVLHKNITK